MLTDLCQRTLLTVALLAGARKNVELMQWPDNGMPWKYAKVN